MENKKYHYGTVPNSNRIDACTLIKKKIKWRGEVFLNVLISIVWLLVV